jgi:hypothetical protein
VFVAAACSLLLSWGAGPVLAAGPPATPPGWLATVQRELAASEYEITWQIGTFQPDLASAYQAPNRAQDLRTYFAPEGLRVIPRKGQAPFWECRFGLPDGPSSRDAASAGLPAPHVEGTTALYDRDGLRLAVDNTPRGLVLRWTLLGPAKESSPHIAPAFLPGGSLLPLLSSDGLSVDFRAGDGGPSVLRLGNMISADATGRSLDVRLVGARVPSQGLSFSFVDPPTWPVSVEGLVTSVSWTTDGNQTEANLGYSVGTAGDVNGDGYSDAIVGVPGYDNGQADEGRAYVYMGGASGLSASPAWTAESNVASASFGAHVGTAGDVNGDGYSDVIVGAWGYTNGESAEGAAFVYLGGSTGLDASPGWTVEGSQASANFGYSVGTAGDVNGDGYSDIIVGAYYYDDGEINEGAAFVYLGSASGPSASPDWMVESDQSGASLGNCVAGAGDVNGDGYSDVLVGVYAYDDGQTDEGRAYLFLGGSSGLSTTPSWTADGNSIGANLGSSLGTAGDVNGDGYADVILGALFYASQGRSLVYLGGALGLSTAPVWTVDAEQGSSRFGGSVGTAGDVNGDGYADILVGAYFFSNPDTHEGKAYLYLGSSAGPSPTPSWTLEGNQGEAVLGASLGTAGDVNGDGYSDVIIGAMLYDDGELNEGRAFVFHGGPDGLGGASAWSSEGNQANAYWGTALASAGDVNGDGFDDFLVASSGYDTAGGANAGKVEFFFGAAGGADTTPDWVLEGTQAEGWLGVSVAGAGDVNGDGYADVLLGEGGYTNGQAREGRALLFLGSASGLAGSPDWTFECDLANLTVGNPVASAGDVNGDGYADVLLGAPTLWDCHCPGRAYLFLGSSAGLAASPNWTAASDQAEAWFGNSVGCAGDVNGDGYSDVFITEHGYSSYQGRALLWLGSAAGLGSSGTPGNADWVGSGDGDAEWFGLSASGAGDVNGDGYSDLLIGAPEHSGGQAREGRVCLFFGSEAGLSTSPSWTAESDQASAVMGYSVCGAGDLNGDGFTDIAAGGFGFDGTAGTDCGKAWCYPGSSSGPVASGAWTPEGSQAGEYFGVRVGFAGDVNGDGFSDFLVCAQSFDGPEADEGRAALFFGGGGAGGGIALRPQQRRYDDSAPIVLLGRSDDRDGFRIAALGRSPYGRGRVRLQTEVKPFGTAFDGADLQTSTWADSGLAGSALQNTVTGVDEAGGYHWRARLLFDPVSLPFQGSGRWFTPPVNGWTELDLRFMPEADLRIASFTDAPDPVNNLQSLTYSLTIENDGPEAADGAAASILLTPAGVSVAFAPGSSDARWVWDSGTSTLTADLGTLADGASTTLDAVFIVSGSGSLGAAAETASSTSDPDSGNDSASASTTVAPSGDLAVTSFTEAPDPVPENTTLTYTLTLANSGPDASSVAATETFTPTGTTMTFLPGSSDARWTWDAGTGTLTAVLGSMASGSTDSLTAAFTAGAPGTIAAHAEVSGSVYDPTAANNAADTAATVCDPTPGAFSLLHPPEGSSSLSTGASFYWTPSDGATSYDLHLGTTSPPPLHASGLTGTETSVDGLTPGTTYFWDVEARTPCGAVLSSDGPRTFTTGCSTRVGRWPGKPYGTVRSSVVHGGYAYYGNGLFLTILDVSDPASPSVVRELPILATVDEGEPLVAEGYLFLPLTNGTLKIYDLADPENPAEIASLGGFAGLRGGMEFNGGLLYVADQTSGLRVVSLSPLTSPSIIGTLATSHARDVTVYEKAFTKYAYVVDAYDGLVVLNVTNPAAPILLGAVDLEDWAESVVRSGEFLFVADSTNGMRVFSLANPALPVEVGSYVTPNYTEWVTISGATAFLCDGLGGIKALDVSTPSAPSLLGQIDTPGLAMHLLLNGDTAFVGDDFGGLRILDVSAPSAMVALGHRDDSEQFTFSLHVDGSTALVPRYGEGLAVMDVSNPSSPSELGLWPRTGGSLRSVTLSGTTAFVSERWGDLHLVDVSNPASPALLGSYTDRFGFQCAVSGSLAYFCADAYGLVVLNVSDPAHPSEIFRLDTPGSARFVALDSGRAYLADASGGLRILDLSDPVHPAPLGSLTFPGNAVAVAVSGPYAYVAASVAGLRIVDVSNPAAPVEVGAYDTPGSAQHVEVWGSTAFVSDFGTGVLLLDVSDPTAPTLAGTLNTPGNAWQTQLVGDSLFVADEFGFVIEDLSSCCSGPPSAFSLEYPAPGSLYAPCSATFQWENASGALRYDVYVDTVDPPLNLVEADLTASQWQAKGFPPATTFYWRVEAKNECGTTPASGSFTTAPVPGAFDLASPSDGAADLGTSLPLRWNASPGAASYSLYLGTSDPPVLYAEGLAGTDTVVSGLSTGATYYWNVVAVSPCGETTATGGRRSFSTGCMSQAGRWPEQDQGPLRSLALNGSYAYFTNGLYLTVLDVSTPSSPIFVREILLPAFTDEGEPVVSGGYLYLPLNSTLLKVFSLADPAHPVEVASLSGFSGFRGGMEIHEGKLYAADQGAGLRIVDVSNPVSPTLLGTYAMSNIRDVAVHAVGPNLYAYIGGFENPLLVLDVTDSGAPVLLNSLPMDSPQLVEGVTRVGDALYVADGEWGLRTFSLADPVNPVQTSFLPPGALSEWMVVDSGVGYMADSTAGVKIFDLSDPLHPAEISSWDDPGKHSTSLWPEASPTSRTILRDFGFWMSARLLPSWR